MSQISKNYQQLAETWQALAIANYIAHGGNSPFVNELESLPYNSTGISDYFKRDSLDKEYVKAVDSPDTPLKFAIAAKIQSDILAILERDTRLQRKTRLDASAAEAFRKFNHANAAGPLNYILSEPRRIMKRDNK